MPILFLCVMSVAAQEREVKLTKGDWRDDQVPPGWQRKIIGRYEFQSNAPFEHVETVARHMNAMLGVYKKFFPPVKQEGKPYVVKIFKDRDGFLKYGAPPGAGGYFSKQDQEMVGYLTAKIGGVAVAGATTGEKPRSLRERLQAKFSMDLLGVFAHEGWHQYFHKHCGSGVPFPSWCDEGIGEYFYGSRSSEGKMITGRVNEYRLGTIKSAIRRNKTIPIKDIVGWDQSQYYAVAGLAYAEGWSLVHFFMADPVWSRKKLLQTYMTTFVEQHSIAEAVEATFKGWKDKDWQALERDWKAFTLNLKYEDAEAEALATEAEMEEGK
jgi:hypothetical protein